MTAITSVPGPLTLVSNEGSARLTVHDRVMGADAAVAQDVSFMTLLQQATAVLPQALQAIRSELPDAPSGAQGDLTLETSDVPPGVILSQLGAVLTVQGDEAALVAGVDQQAIPGMKGMLAASARSDGSMSTMAVLPDDLTSTVLDADQQVPVMPAVTRLTSDAVLPSVSPHRAVQSPVGSQAWADEIGARLTVLGARGEHTASLRLSPEHLGPLEIRLTIQEDRASVWFGAAHAQTREAIEQALPRLREMLQSQGLTLSDAGVSDESPSRESAVRQSGDPRPDEDAGERAMQALHYHGLLDLYV